MQDVYLTSTFIERSKKLHNDFYDYSKVSCTKHKDIVTIICPIHGEFRQSAYVHIRGSGCRSCGNSSPEEFKKIVEGRHNIFYEIESFTYKGVRDDVVCICPIHGFIKETADKLLKRGCKRCRFPLALKEDFIAKAVEIHQDLYDYTDMDFENKTSHDKVSIYCKFCETNFNVTIRNHIANKSGCPSCKYTRRSLKYKRVNNENSS